MTSVLLINEATGAGVGRHVIDLCRGLLARQVDLHLIYSPRRMDRTFEAGLQRMPDLKTLAMPMRTGPHPSDASVGLRIRSYMKQHGPFSVVHGHSSKGGALARLVCTGSRSRSVFTPHASIVMNPLLSSSGRWFYGSCEFLLGRMSDAIVALTAEEQACMLRVTRLTPQVVRIIPNAIDAPGLLPRAEALSKLNLDADRLWIGFVGRMASQKNPKLAIEAFAQVHERFPKTGLALIGEGELLPEMQRRVQELGIGHSVRFLGGVPAQESMQAFELLLMTSRYEGMPYVLLEAAHAGLPIISTDVSGASAVIQQEVTGFIVSRAGSGPLAAKIEILMADATLRQQMGTVAKKSVQALSVDTMVEQTLALYRELSPSSATTPIRASTS